MKIETLLKKIDGKTFTEQRETLVSSKPYLDKKEICFSESINIEKLKGIKKESLVLINSTINTMFQEILRFENGVVFDKLINDLKKIKTREDLIEIANCIKIGYQHIVGSDNSFNVTNTLKEYQKAMDEYTDLVFSIIVKKIIYNYIFKLISKFNSEEIKRIEYVRNTTNNLDLLLDTIGVELNEATKENGVYELCKKYAHDVISVAFDETQKHLCFDCQNAHPYQCEKITQRFYDTINRYDYITDGYQIIDNKDRIQIFVVTKCKNFKMDEPKKLTSSDLARIRKLKDSMFLSYYDAETVKEAEDAKESIERRLNPKKRYYI